MHSSRNDNFAVRAVLIKTKVQAEYQATWQSDKDQWAEWTHSSGSRSRSRYETSQKNATLEQQPERTALEDFITEERVEAERFALFKKNCNVEFQKYRNTSTYPSDPTMLLQCT